MQTPIDFGKEFLNKLFDQRDADACMEMLAGDLVWITPENLHHFLSEGAVLRFVRKQVAAEAEPRYVDLVSIKSSPSADNIMTVAYEINLVSKEDERPLYLRCSMAICRRSKRLEITFLHFSKKSERDSTEQLRDFVTNLPCGVMILACLDGRREEAIYYNDYFAHRLKYKQEEFARAIRRNPFFMASEEDRSRIRDEIEKARKNGGSIAANLHFYRRDGNSFYYRMKGAPAYQANGGTVYYCVFQETTGFQLNADRLQERLDEAAEVIRRIPEGICGIEYAPGSRTLQTLAADREGDGGTDKASAEGAEDEDVRTYKKGKGSKDFRNRSGKDARVFFASKNIPSMFGVSNSVYTGNILKDPLFGLEITSITRKRLLSSHLFSPEKASTGKAQSCGIFRLHRPDGKSFRVELVVRRIQEQDGTTRLYLFYYDREEQQLDVEKRLEHAAKMGRAAQEQLRAELKKEKDSAVRKQTELKSELEAERENHRAAVSRIEDQLLEEKNRCVLMSRQLEESRAVQKKMAAELEKSEADASKRMRNYLARADRKVAEANTAVFKARQDADQRVQQAQSAAEEEVSKARQSAEERIGEVRAAAEAAAKETRDERDLLEEQLREAQERSRLLEAELRSERARRVLLEEQLRSGGKSLPELLQRDAERVKDQAPGNTVPAVIGAAERVAVSTVPAAGTSSGAIEVRTVSPASPVASKADSVSPFGTAAVNIAEPASPMASKADSVSPFGTAAVNIAEPASPVASKAGSVSPFGTAAVNTAEPVSPGASKADSVSPFGTAAVNIAEPASPGTNRRTELSAGDSDRKEEKKREERRRRGDWMTGEKPLTVFSSMDVARSHSESDENGYAARSDSAWDGKTLEAVFRPEEALRDPKKTEGESRRSLQSLFSAGERQDQERTPEEQAAAAENRIRAQEFDRAKVRLQSLMSMADTFLRSKDGNPGADESAPGECAADRNDSSGYSMPCSRDNIGTVMNDFLEAASPAEGLLREKPFSPEECLRNVLIYEGVECGKKGISLRNIHDSMFPDKVTGFGTMLQRALCELIEQAIARTQPGGTITVHSRADRPSGGFINIYFRIDDNGTGISEREMQTLFESKTAAGESGPFKSGMFSAREAATLMGGSIHAQSGSRGSSFSLSVTVHENA